MANEKKPIVVEEKKEEEVKGKTPVRVGTRGSYKWVWR